MCKKSLHHVIGILNVLNSETVVPEGNENRWDLFNNYSCESIKKKKQVEI